MLAIAIEVPGIIMEFLVGYIAVAVANDILQEDRSSDQTLLMKSEWMDKRQDLPNIQGKQAYKRRREELLVLNHRGWTK